MGLVPKASFSTGELDPVLQERTTLDKFKNGLATARNVIVGKTGSVLSRPGRSFIVTGKLDNSLYVNYSPRMSGIWIEWGHQYVRVYTFNPAPGSGPLLFDTAHALTAADIPNLHFETSTIYIYIFCAGKLTLKFNYVTGAFVTAANVFSIPPAPVSVSGTAAGTPTGYYVDYAVTYIQNGQESAPIYLTTASTLKLPIADGQSNVIDAELFATIPTGVSEMRVYRRPQSAGAYGLIGSTNYFYTPSGTLYDGVFTDFGGAADYSQSIPTIIQTPDSLSPVNFNSKTGVVYQQRLIISDDLDKEAILATRPGFQNDMYRDYPLGAASALKFKAGTSGYARVLRMLDSDGLVVFTTAGVFLNTGPLDVSNLALAKKGTWIIQDNLPALPVPGGVFFVDAATNSVRNLVWSYQLAGYYAEELSIYSAHLFFKKVVTSWAFQEGNFPLLWCTFDDGTFASFTYEFDHDMKAWTRHDSSLFVESVAGTGLANKTLFVVKNGTTRYTEVTIARNVSGAALASNPDADKNQSCALMDSIFTNDGNINQFLTGADNFQFNFATSNVAQDWGGVLTLRAGTSSVFNATVAGGQIPVWPTPIVGVTIRAFDSDKTAFDFKIVKYTSPSEVDVQPVLPLPLELQVGARLYQTFNVLTVPNFSEGEAVSVVVDGFVISSPNNDIDNYTPIIVTGGTITLPNGLLGAIIHVGRPITADVETLEIDTVEQAPTLIESELINKMYVKVHNSTGLYVGARFPLSNLVKGMQDLDLYRVDYSDPNPIIGNRYKQPDTKRVEITVPGDWKRQGKIALRQVDPVHFEILSIIPDVEVLTRSDR